MATITKIPFTTTTRRRSRAAEQPRPKVFEAIVATAGTLRQAQTLPRVRLQTIVSFLIFIAFVAGVNSMVLFMESQIGLAGRDIISQNSDMMTLRLHNEDLLTQLSQLRSVKVLHQRAVDAGFVLASLEDVTYIYVPGFTGHANVNLSEGSATAPEATLDPAYTESLVTWILRNMEAASAPLTDL